MEKIETIETIETVACGYCHTETRPEFLDGSGICGECFTLIHNYGG